MNDFSDLRSKTHPIDMETSIHVQGVTRHLETVGQYLRDDYTGFRELCDVQFRFDAELVPAHAAMISAFSPTFANKFKVTNKCHEADLSFLSKKSVLQVLEFIYHGRVTLCFETLPDDLDAISYFGVTQLQEQVEKKLVEMAKKRKCVKVLNMVTTNLRTIPHSPSTLLATSDETVALLVGVLHEAFQANQLSYEEILKLSANTVISMLSSRIEDQKKIDVINMALKWIYERRVNDYKASNILRALTIGSMTYAQLIQLRNSLIQTAIPVTIGRCVRLKRNDNDTVDIVFMHTENSGHHWPDKLTTTSSFTLLADPTVPLTSPSRTSTPSSHTQFDGTDRNVSSSASSFSDYNIDDCKTAISFNSEDLKLLGFQKRN